MTFLLVIFWFAIILGTIAGTMALYGRYRILPAFLSGPATCQLEAGGCTVLRTKEAALFGLPNALFGIILYAFLAVGTLANWPTRFLVIAATPGFFMSIYLANYLLKNHLQCRICWAGHLSNSMIWLGLIVRLFLSREISL